MGLYIDIIFPLLLNSYRYSITIWNRYEINVQPFIGKAYVSMHFFFIYLNKLSTVTVDKKQKLNPFGNFFFFFLLEILNIETSFDTG